ncbi:effector-associated constant component EACC1 [Kutzneria albida]|uniref:Uncharacterized protein n=1 Tax=Kutzneria albida DSM 43870 TaxID=1449976 RepID=W5W9D1_9PSEU|nr:hypothetical protein [Kutzneria albida]AHH94804.1 hypothetical protein KALB_1431 [Kutzneria albida DSM 43870]
MTSVSLTLHGDPDEVDEQVRLLREELLHLDVDRVEFAADPEGAPAGTRAVDPAGIDTVIVAVTGSPVLIQLGRVLRDWVRRGSTRRITVREGKRSLEIIGANDADNAKVIEAFFRAAGED